MNEWINQELIQHGDYGFIYKITNQITGEYYIGKKTLRSYTTINKKKVFRESNWKNYFGSNKEFTQHVKDIGKDNFKREILTSCQTSIQLTYYEIHYCILHDWLSDKCYNENLLGKIFKGRLK